jgi:alpha-beta hydrolase superfamily lysophospholipase
METLVTFNSEGLAMAGDLSVPHGAAGRKPAIIILHGWGGHREGPQELWSQAFYSKLGYATLRFDFRGCGNSQGKRALVLPHDQVADTRNAVTFLANRPDIDPVRIAVSGTNFGACVAVYAAGLDSRIAGVIAQAGWANGEHMFRAIHRTPAAWDRFMGHILRGRQRKPADVPLRMHRFDIIPLPVSLRLNIDARTIMEFPIEVVMEMLAFNPGDVAARIAPRPLLLLHGAKDQLIVPDGSMELFRAAGGQGDLHIIDGADHFMFNETDRRVADIVRNWLAKAFPVS